MDLISKDYIINYLISEGCKRWQKHNFDRIYLTEKLIHTLLDISIGYYNTGNISVFYYDGEKVSNSKGRKILAALDTKFFFDVPTATYKSKDPSEYADEIFDRLTAKIETEYIEDNAKRKKTLYIKEIKKL